MKNIELTEDHKTKLLEMCKTLFPEYDDKSLGGTGPISFHHNNLYPGMLFGFKSNGEDGDSYDHASLFIHWFEFCVTKLSLKILCQNKSIINSSYSKNYFLQNKIINSDEHIINYLYKEFKKLK